MHSEEACENQSAQPEFNDDNDNQENGTNCDLDVRLTYMTTLNVALTGPPSPILSMLASASEIKKYLLSHTLHMVTAIRRIRNR